MLARIRKSQDGKDQGFTLIELLVVMVIIGILSAIAIPVFANQRNKAYDAAAKSDVANIGREIATYYVDNTAELTGFTPVVVAGGNGTWAFAEPGPKGTFTNGVTDVNVARTVSTNWCVQAKSQSTKIFSYSMGGPKQAAC